MASFFWKVVTVAKPVARKDKKGRALRKGESQRSSDGRYIYQYTDIMGKRRVIYAKDLVSLREKEKELVRNQLDGVADYVNRKVTLNYVFDRYISTKRDLREQTRVNYKYTYNRYVRDKFGKRLIGEIRYSDVKSFYLSLLDEHGIKVTTLDNVHTVLHPVFEMAVRDDVLRKNPSDRVMGEIKKLKGEKAGTRHALTREQQKAFLDFVENDPIYQHWAPLMIVLFGTGMRIGECIGLRWEDLDFKNREIDVNHTLTYHQMENGKCRYSISETKTSAGARKIPMMGRVYEAFQAEYEYQEINGFNLEEVDGMEGFVFRNRYGDIMSPASVNKAIRRLYETYNAQEVLTAAREKRDPLLIPHFTCHYIRHTFCTRLCETETNLKVIQDLMGHADIQTTMDIYAEATDSKKKEAITLLNNDNSIF